MPFPHSFPFPLGAFYSQTAPIGEKVNISKTISLKRKFLSFLGEINFILRNIGRHRSISALLGEHGSISRLIHVFRIKTSVLGILPLKNKLFHYARIVISKIGLLTQNISYTYFHLNRHTIMFFITHLGIKSIFSSIKHLLMGLNSRIGILSIQIRLDYSLHFISLNGMSSFIRAKFLVFRSMVTKFGIVSTLRKSIGFVRVFVSKLKLQGLLIELTHVFIHVYIGIKSAKIAHRKMGEALYLIIRKLLFLRR